MDIFNGCKIQMALPQFNMVRLPIVLIKPKLETGLGNEYLNYRTPDTELVIKGQMINEYFQQFFKKQDQDWKIPEVEILKWECMLFRACGLCRPPGGFKRPRKQKTCKGGRKVRRY
jgi:hypothetical protein